MSNTFEFHGPARLATDPTITYTATGTPRSTFRIAVDDRKQLEDGTWETAQTVFHDAVAFGKRAESIASMFQSGDAVLILGKLKASININEGKTYTNWSIKIAHMAPDPARAHISIDRTPRTKGDIDDEDHGPTPASSTAKAWA